MADIVSTHSEARFAVADRKKSLRMHAYYAQPHRREESRDVHRDYTANRKQRVNADEHDRNEGL
jgi:hypothetical protein